MSFFQELKRRNVIRVAVAYVAGAWLLIQVLETLFPIYGLSETALQVVVTALAIGVVPIIAITWAFELTPEGLKRDSAASRAEARRWGSAKWLDRAIIVLLALALGYFAFDKFVITPQRQAGELAAATAEARQEGRTEAVVSSYGDKSIAVLPFADLSPEGDQAYFADGVAEEILNLLAKVRGLRVISRSSAFQYRGEVHIPTVAEALNVSYVLEGSVRKAGDQLRVTAQLIDARADAHTWSENYDRELRSVFEIQDEIAAEIVEELEIRLLDKPPRSDRTDPEAYALYLQANHVIAVRNEITVVAEELLKRALELDPDYVPALNLMVQAIFTLTGQREQDKYTPEEGIALMRSYVDRALAIDPKNSRATAHRGWMAFFYNNDLETAASYINRALSYDPLNSNTLFVASVISRRIGRNDDAMAFAEAALESDPLCSNCLYTLMQASFRSGRYDKALAASERRMRLAEGGWISRGRIYLFKGDARMALQLYDKQKENVVSWLADRAIALHELGDTAARDAALAELTQIDARDALVNVARVHAWVGNIDEAFAWLDRYIRPDSPNFTQEFTGILWNPFFRNLWDDPRWLALRERANLGPERLNKIRLELPAAAD